MYILNLLQYKYLILTFLYGYSIISYTLFIDLSSLCMLPIIYKAYITPNVPNYIYYLLLIFTNTIKFTQSNIYIGSSLILVNNLLDNNLLDNYKITNYYRLLNECIFSILNSILLLYIISKINYIHPYNNTYTDNTYTYNNTDTDNNTYTYNQCYIT